MARLIWNEEGERIFRTGVDRGVLYTGPSNLGVAWQGLTSVEEKPSGGTPSSYYIDGIKYRSESSLEEFEATIKAYTYPDEFASVDGTIATGSGITYGQQERKPFHFSYRTRIGNDIQGSNFAYKIHLVYNALTSPASVSNETIAGTPVAALFSWDITTTPVRISGRKPTSYITIDSRYSAPELMEALEYILYGTAFYSPRMPSLQEVIDLFDDWEPLEIKPVRSTGINPLLVLGQSDLIGNTYKGLYTMGKDQRLTRTAVPGLYSLE
jgi:hypothetical protein